ncbi:Histone acetyltransferase, partial [Spiromyces aspiralis]
TERGARAPTLADVPYLFGGQLTERQADTRPFVPSKRVKTMYDEAHLSYICENSDQGPAGEDQQSQGTRTNGTNTPIPHAETSGGKSIHTTPAAAPPTLPQIEAIRLGGYEINTWYISPYPEEYTRQRILYICEFCLKYMKGEYVYHRHCKKCLVRHPPGDEIYRDGNLSIFEIYCQNLCLLAKMFLDTKTLYYDVEPFLFYVLCEYDKDGYHFAGYFSKEKRSAQGYNLSCIMILPSKQREGYGKFLIEFSKYLVVIHSPFISVEGGYLLTRKEGQVGSPEKPLSDFGMLSYRSYWRRAVYELLLDVKKCGGGDGNSGSAATETAAVSIKEISRQTGMTPDDVISILQTDGMLRRDPGDEDRYVIRVQEDDVREYLEKSRKKAPRRVDASKLRWAPFLIKRPTTPFGDAVQLPTLASAQVRSAGTAIASGGDGSTSDGG